MYTENTCDTLNSQTVHVVSSFHYNSYVSQLQSLTNWEPMLWKLKKESQQSRDLADLCLSSFTDLYFVWQDSTKKIHFLVSNSDTHANEATVFVSLSLVLHIPIYCYPQFCSLGYFHGTI